MPKPSDEEAAAAATAAAATAAAATAADATAAAGTAADTSSADTSSAVAIVTEDVGEPEAQALEASIEPIDFDTVESRIPFLEDGREEWIVRVLPAHAVYFPSACVVWRAHPQRAY